MDGLGSRGVEKWYAVWTGRDWLGNVRQSKRSGRRLVIEVGFRSDKAVEVEHGKRIAG